MSTTSYERLIDNLRTEVRPQRHWGEGRGIFMVVGHFVVGIAAGVWLFAMLYASAAGLALGFVLGALGGLAHLFNLGHPARAWRMLAQFRTSWVSRGFVGLALFLVGAFLCLVPLWVPASPWSSASGLATLGYWLASIGMLVMMGYMGFVYSSSKAIPFWNSPLHPALYIAYALRGGVAGLLLVQVFGAPSMAGFGELLVWWVALTAIASAFYALELYGAWTGGNVAAQRSVQDLVAGRVAVYFYGGTLALGLLVPAWLVQSGLSGEASMQTLAALAIASALGDFFMKYSTIRAGFHLPVWTRRLPQRT